jgi:hypothetical protein
MTIAVELSIPRSVLFDLDGRLQFRIRDAKAVLGGKIVLFRQPQGHAGAVALDVVDQDHAAVVFPRCRDKSAAGIGCDVRFCD